MEVNNSKKKTKLTTSPFIHKFQYEINNNSYWNYNTMILQLEDIIDCLRVIYKDKYEYLFFITLLTMASYVLID